MKFEDDKSVDVTKVEVIEGHPFCKEHGAMNLLNGIWRCYSMYYGNADGVYPKGVTPHKFIERTCNAAMREIVQ